MSLFKMKEWWSSGSVTAEGCLLNPSSLKVAQLGGEGGVGDTIILGATDGLLQLFRPQGAFQPTDVILEYMMDHPILQVETGRFVYGSDSEQLAILHPKSFTVFSLLVREGQVAFGQQNILSEEYHHSLPRSAHSLVVGKFGGEKEQHFVCVQSVDCVLMFFEREIATFSCRLPGALLPAPLLYDHCSDAFITCSDNWIIESYSYRILSQASEFVEDDVVSRKLVPDWVYNIGENIIQMEKVQNTNRTCCLLMLGEQTLYGLNNNGTLRFMKRLDYEPICFYAYLIGWYHEPNARVMSMVVSETSALLIYEESRLLWACNLVFLPRGVSRGHFRGLAGALVLLAPSGELHCGYLGTEPELLAAPPLPEQTHDYEKVHRELEELEGIIRSQYDAGEIALTNSAAERELPFTIYINQSLQINDHKHDVTFEHETENELIPNLLKCSIEVRLKPLNVGSIQFIQVTFVVQPPLSCSNISETCTEITEDLRVSTEIFIKHSSVVQNTDLIVIVMFTNNLGNVYVLKKQENLPFKLVCHPTKPMKEARYKVTLMTDEATIDLLQLFHDFDSDPINDSGGSSSGIAFASNNRPQTPVTVIAARTSQRYRVQSDDCGALAAIVNQLRWRLAGGRGRPPRPPAHLSLTATSPPPTELIAALAQAATQHLQLRQKLFQTEEQLDVLTSQFILVQRRLMMKYREKPPTSCKGMGFLLQETYSSLSKTTTSLQKLHKEIFESGCELSSCIQLILVLLDIRNSGGVQYAAAKSALSPFALNQDYQAWEETAWPGILHLLKTTFFKSEKDGDRYVPFGNAKLITEYDVSLFAKHLRILIERAFGQTSVPDNEIQSSVDEREKENVPDVFSVPFGSKLGMPVVRILEEKVELEN